MYLHIKLHTTTKEILRLNQELEERVTERTAELSTALYELQNTHLQLVQSEKMSALGNLVSGVAHEINNPVNFLVGNLQPAQDYIKDLFGLINLYQQEYPNPSPVIQNEINAIDLEYLLEDLPKLLNSMNEGVNRIRDISTSLRTFSRGDNDRFITFNIHDGLDSSVLILKHRLKASETRPEIEVVKNYGNLHPVECFPGQLNQVFMNLLANAIDALDESNTGRSFEEIKTNPNRITIATKMSDDRKHVVISIKDNGVGMTEHVQIRIFYYLFTTKAVGKGTGLGLTITRQIIVEKHGGTIEINSALGQGAEFVITIPA